MKQMGTREWIAVAVALAAIYVLLIGINPFASKTAAPAVNQTVSGGEAGTVAEVAVPAPTPATELSIKDLVPGTGDVATNGKTVQVNYIGTLENGTKFDSSYDRKQPLSFVLGSGQVIQGWEQGLIGMKVGGKRHLVIPASLGYGNHQVGPIPPNSTLIFDVELLGVSK